MKRGQLLGSLEQIILLALVRLDGNAHGMIVRREIEECTGRNISIGAVYATLERLEAKEYVSSFTGEPTPERGGRRNGFSASKRPAKDRCKYPNRLFAA
jgi:PadR family transcriptional regulator, regulatory protein PadR